MAKKSIKFILLFAVFANSIRMNFGAKSNPKDFLVQSQCTARCLEKRRDIPFCRQSCANETSTMKLGGCPEIDDDGIDFMMNLRNCSNTCHENDYECPDDFKCCKVSGCSFDCRKPEFGEFATNYAKQPCMPESAEIVEMEPYESDASFNWKLCDEEVTTPTVFSVESRNHIGPKLNISQFSEFQLHPYHIYGVRGGATSIINRYMSKVRLKGGRFYQFRIASINKEGSRGYAYSNSFILKRDPRPPKPLSNVKFFGTWTSYDNQTVSKFIKWTPTKSELPVDKIKITWLRKSDGKFVEGWKALVGTKRRFYEIRGLQLNSTYSVRLQAMSTYGTKRLKSFVVSGQLETPQTLSSNSYKPKKFASSQAKPQKIKKMPDQKPVIQTKSRKEIRALQRQRKKFNLKIES